MAGLLQRLRERNGWKFFTVLFRADPALAATWWTVAVLRGLLPVAFAFGMGSLVGAVQAGAALAGPLALVGSAFVLLQILAPIHRALSANLGDRTAAWLYDRLTDACVGPPGIGHLEDASLTSDLVTARDFDRGMTGPPLSIAMDFIANGTVEMIAGIASALVLTLYAWWAPLLLGGAWMATHWWLRESAVWRDRNTEVVRRAQRDADYLYRLAVDPPAAKEVRLFGLGDWILDAFIERRTRLHALQYQATRLREKPVVWSLFAVVTANVIVFWSLTSAAAGGQLTLAEVVLFAQASVGASAIAFGGMSWALDGVAAPVGAVLRLQRAMAPAGALGRGHARRRRRRPREVRFRDVTFAYPGGAPVLDRLNLTIPAGSSLAIVGQNGAGKTTHCQAAVPFLRSAERRDRDRRRRSARVRSGLVARAGSRRSFRISCVSNCRSATMSRRPARRMPSCAPRSTRRAPRRWRRSIRCSPAATTAALTSRAASGSGSPSRAPCAPWSSGAGVVLLDEPTAQLDVRGEAEIFERVLRATRRCTTILISHRFSTVRQADRICVIEHGRVVELGTHDELMALAGRYRTMFDLQAQRFTSAEDEEGRAYDVLG